MTINENKRQKKLQKKKKKQKLAKRSSISHSYRSQVSTFSKYPIHECLVPNNLFESGIGNVVISRLLPGGDIGVCAYIVDVFCLGVKNALFTLSNSEHYENVIKMRLCESHEAEFEIVPAAFAKNIIVGAVGYAKNLGLSPHKDYQKYKIFLADIDSSDCNENFVFGENGKPFYIRGPKETAIQSKKIINLLHKNCGEGNYNYLLATNPF